MGGRAPTQRAVRELAPLSTPTGPRFPTISRRCWVKRNPSNSSPKRWFGWGDCYRAKYGISTHDVRNRTNARPPRSLFGGVGAFGKARFGDVSRVVSLGHHAQTNDQAAAAREKDARVAIVDVPKALD